MKLLKPYMIYLRVDGFIWRSFIQEDNSYLPYDILTEPPLQSSA